MDVPLSYRPSFLPMSELNQFHRNQIGHLNVQRVLNVLNNLNSLTPSPRAFHNVAEALRKMLSK